MDDGAAENAADRSACGMDDAIVSNMLVMSYGNTDATNSA
jgi:hypothetical protein